MRRDEQRLQDIIEALESVARIIQGKPESAFYDDETLRYAVAHRLAVVGEAAGRISSELRAKYQSAPWTDIVSFRNILIHEYFGIHWPIVWHTATEQAPRLLEEIARIRRAEFP